MGHHYKMPKLSDFARDRIEKILRSHWSDGAFLGAVKVALTYPDDHALHKALFSAGRAHLYSLTPSGEFDPATFLRSFHSGFRAFQSPNGCKEPLPTTTPSSVSNEQATDSFAEVEKLKSQVSVLQKRVSELCIERDELQHRVSEISNERNEQLQLALKEVETFRSQVSDLQQQASDTSSERDELKRQVSQLSKDRDGLQKAVTQSQKEAEKRIAAALQQATGAQEDAKIASTKLVRASSQAAEAERRAEKAEKSLSTFQTELKSATSERNLLRVRWQDGKAKSSALAKEIDDLKLSLDLERDIRDTVPIAVRDELKQSLEAEQGEVKRLTTELEKAQRSLSATGAQAAANAQQSQG
jgi:DNA repair exonuclease SbcCD ATPase subunit